MAKHNKINTDLGELPDPNFSDAIIFIFNLLTLNVLLFNGIPVTMGVLGPVPANSFGDLVSRFNSIRLAPVYAGQVADTIKARMLVQLALTKNGNWLNTFCNGDLALLKKTGYPLAKEDEAQGKLGETILTIFNEIGTGYVDFMISMIKGNGIHYGIMYTLVSNSETNPALWSFYYASQRNGTMKMLEPSAKYKMVSFAMGTDNDLTYSEVVLVTAL